MATDIVQTPVLYTVTSLGRHRLEGGLLAGEITKTTTVETTAAARSTTTTATATATASTTSTAAAKAATVTTAWAGRAVVKTQGAAGKVTTLESIESSSSLVNGRELDVAEALGTPGLGVRGQTDAREAAVLREHLANHALVSAESNVADEKGVALRAGLVTERLGAALSLLSVVVGRASVGEVEVDGTTINLSTLLRLVSLGRIGGAGELDITEAASS